MESSRSSLALNTTRSGFEHRQYTTAPHLDTLISHLVAAKRSLSSVSSLWRANEIVTTARSALEESVAVSCRTSFLRRELNNQLRLLYDVRSEVENVSRRGRQEFIRALESLDAADVRLRATLDLLRSTTVHASFKPQDEVSRTLHDFVEERGVEELHAAMKGSIDKTNAALADLDTSNREFDSELKSIKQSLRHYRSVTRLASSRLSASSSSSSTSESDVIALSTLPSMLQSLEGHAHEMAGLLEALVRHFDLCVTAVKHTEGGGAAARSITGDMPAEVQANTDAMPQIGEEIQANLNAPLAPLTDTEYLEMVNVLAQDAREAEDVVREIQDRITEMESIHEQVNGHRDVLIGISSATLEVHYHLSTLASSRLPQYISQARRFTGVWREENERLNAGLGELSDLHSLFEGYLNAYDSLVLEVDRRSQIRSRVEKVLRDTRNKLNHLYDEDVTAREAFRAEYGDFLPSDLWPGISHAPMRVQFHRVAGGELESVLEEARVAEQDYTRQTVDENNQRNVVDDPTAGEVIPNLPTDVVNQAYARLKARTRAFA